MIANIRNLQLIVATIDQGQVNPRRRIGRFLTALIVVGVAVCLIAGFTLTAAVVLWRTWQSTDWSLFWAATIIAPAYAAVLLIGIVAARRFVRRLVPASAVLREAAATGDERLAPLAARQPAPISPSADVSARSGISFGPLRRPGSSQAALGTPIMLLLIFEFIVAVPVLSTFLQTSGGSSASGVFIILPLFALLLVLIAGQIFLRWRAQRGMTVSAYRDELTWRRSWLSPQKRISLLRARAFFQVTMTAPYTFVQSTTYVVDTPDGVLAWTDRHDASDDEFEASSRLSSYIATVSGLPLRDLSAFASELGQTSGQVKRVLTEKLRLTQEASDAHLLQRLIATSAHVRTAGSRRRLGVWALVGVVVILFASLYGFGGWLQDYQTTYFAGLAAKVETQQPLYYNRLTSDDGTWPTLPAQSGAGMIGYDSGAYHVTGTSRIPAYAAPAIPFGDAAVEVTARESGRRPDGTPDGVGLVLRASAHPADMLVFMVRSNARWSLYHYTPDTTPQSAWHWLTGGVDYAINTADGAPNQLLVIMRGRVFLCYVNGGYVGSYFDEQGQVYGHGSVGVFNNNGGLDAAFTDFFVFPVRPFSSLDFV